MEVLPFDQYTIRIDGSHRLTKRNRRFLRSFQPATTTISQHQPQSTQYPQEAIVNQTNPSVVVEQPNPTTLRPVTSGGRVSDGGEVMIPPDEPATQLPVSPALPAAAPMEIPVSRGDGRKQSLSVRRLRDHNKPGLKEQDVVPGLRRKR
jgi:hypothetical protein